MESAMDLCNELRALILTETSILGEKEVRLEGKKISDLPLVRKITGKDPKDVEDAKKIMIQYFIEKGELQELGRLETDEIEADGIKSKATFILLGPDKKFLTEDGQEVSFKDIITEPKDFCTLSAIGRQLERAKVYLVDGVKVSSWREAIEAVQDILSLEENEDLAILKGTPGVTYRNDLKVGFQIFLKYSTEKIYSLKAPKPEKRKVR